MIVTNKHLRKSLNGYTNSNIVYCQFVLNGFLKYFIPCFFFLGMAASGYAQQSGSVASKQGQALVDSLVQELPRQKEDTNKVKLLNNISYSYWYINPDEGIKYGRQGLELATKLNWKKGTAKANNSLGINYHFKSDYVKEQEYYFKALKISEEIGDKRGIANVTANIGGVYQRLNDYPKALEYYFKALKTDVESGDKNSIAIVTSNIGGVYQLLGDYPKALEYYFKGLQLDKESGNKYGIAIGTGNIGQVYCKEKNYAGGIDYFQRSLKIAEEIGDKYMIAGNLLTIGITYVSLVTDTARDNTGTGGSEMAKRKYLPARQPGEADIVIPKGKAALLRQAIDYLQRSLDTAREMHAMDILEDCYKTLADAYKLNGNYKRALECADNYRAIKDSIFSKNNSEQLLKMSMKNEFDRQHLADSLKAAEKEKISALRLQRQKSYTILGITGILLLAGFSFFIQQERRKSEHERKKSDELLLNILPGEVANELKANGSTKARQFENVTVLFTDFVNFTIAGERMSPQSLIDELHTCFKAFDNIIEKYNIEKIKTIGDAYLAVCGLPLADQRHAENVVKAAIEINAFVQDRIAKLGERTFQVRIGIHSGSVVAGIVGVKKFAYDVWGDTVNTAARMEQNSEAGKINISQSTYELVKDKFTCQYRGELEVKNKGEMKMYFVTT